VIGDAVPELPEVERTRRALRAAMAGRRIDRVILRRRDLRFPLQPDFVRRLRGQTVTAVTRRAKYLALTLSSGDVLLAHLGMSGSFEFRRRPGRPFEPHDHVVFVLDSGAAVVFNDPRRFGSMRVIARDQAAGDPVLAALGPEPRARDFNGAALARALWRRRRPLKIALADQGVVAGLGNIYVCEALHLARLSPRRRASTLATASGAPRAQAHSLAEAIRAVLERALARRPRGAGRFRVYDREGALCPRRGCGGVVRRIVQAGRSTFYCPRCQR
jgi:formamidopyrimidine-DNA glycosylase